MTIWDYYLHRPLGPQLLGLVVAFIIGEIAAYIIEKRKGKK